MSSTPGGSARRAGNNLEFVALETIEGMSMEEYREARRPFSELISIDPNEVFKLETEPERLTTRVIDLLSLPVGIMRRTALIHMSINLGVVVLYVINLWMRAGTPDNLRTPFVLSLIAIGLLLISGWLGGKMVYELGVAVDTTSTEATMRRP